MPVLLVAVAVLLIYITVEEEPTVIRAAPVDYTTVAASKALVKRLKLQIESADEAGTTLAITEEELVQIAQLGAHTFDWLDIKLYFDSEAIHTSMSLRLLPNPFGRYLNLGVRVGQGSEGVGIDRLSVGPMELSGRWLLPLVARLADTLLRDNQATLLLSSIRGLHIEGDTVLLLVVPPPDVKGQIKQAVRTLQASRFPPGEPERVVRYYDMLVTLGAQRDGGSHSLGAYLTPLLAEAAQRQAGSSAVMENRAVLWALTVYCSNGAFETLVGKLVSSQRALVRAPPGITLGGREDLMTHFLYSAGITLATRQGIGVAAGEFKELLDSGGGGSGFSFADLAADRAGIAFVTAATVGESAAWQLQQRMIASTGESDFFPDVSGLQEGLGEEQFQQRYGSIQSARYQEQLTLIDQRIARLPVYRP